MTYVLDTNAWIAYLSRRNARLIQRFLQEDPAEIALSAVVLAELFYGAHDGAPNRLAANLALIGQLQRQFASLPFDDQAAAKSGEIRAYLAVRGTPIGPNDLLIASIALSNNLTLVTNNTSEFSRVPGLKLEDWT